ncbi:MAG: hypothetical protein HC878_12690, partial [Leptolyngbyaceae cyanobacterium SL_5_14]|nr:hypothetical protein [Leptolyngbyaceae cyanobacterium SL_5_14]
MPQHANLSDIATLKNDAYHAQTDENWDLAEQLWIRVLAAASGQDADAVRALQRIAVKRHTEVSPPQAERFQSTEASANSTAELKEDTSEKSTPPQILRTAGQSSYPPRPQSTVKAIRRRSVPSKEFEDLVIFTEASREQA